MGEFITLTTVSLSDGRSAEFTRPIQLKNLYVPHCIMLSTLVGPHLALLPRNALKCICAVLGSHVVRLSVRL